MDETPPAITDPARIRALAHPIRLELIDFLHRVGEATATECAEHIGESVASCSFHLRQLEKYGYIERAERRGREKPWRAAQGRLDMRPSPDVPGSLHAVAELGGLNVLRQAERMRDFLAQAHREPDEWMQATTIAGSAFWATAEEMAELSREIQEITQRFADRDDDPGQRPEGARLGRLFATVNPEPMPEEK